MSVNNKECVVCNQVYPEEYFYSAGVKKGKSYKRRKCKHCFMSTKKHRRYFNRDWVADYKSKLSCKKCGYSKETHSSFKVQALQFHHHENNKSFEISNGVQRGMSIDKIKKEINKCEVLCSRCHAESHF